MSDLADIPAGTLCANCQEHPATVRFDDGNIGLMAFTHGFLQHWCECCVLRKSISHAEEQAARLGLLRAELANACPGTSAPDPAALTDANAALRKEVARQWDMAHAWLCASRHYPEMAVNVPHPEGEHCYWPKPRILGGNHVQ